MLRTEMERKGTYTFLRNFEDFREQPRKAEHLARSLHPGTHAAGHWGHSTEGDAAQGSRMENSLSVTTLGGCEHRVVTVIAAPTEGQVPS